MMIVSCVILFYYLGLAFLAGIAVSIIAFYVNLRIGRVASAYFKAYMKKQDARVRGLTESINNIKMLKMYSWTHIFFDYI